MITQLLESLFTWISGVIAAMGYPGIALLMAIESCCIPLPSEMIMPFAGWLVATGRFSLWGIALAVGLYGSGAGTDPAEVAAYYASSADRLRQIGGFAALLAGCGFLLVYVVVLVRGAEKPRETDGRRVLQGAGPPRSKDPRRDHL